MAGRNIFSDLLSGYRRRPEDEYYDKEYYEEDYDEEEDEAFESGGYDDGDEYVDLYEGLSEEEEEEEAPSFFSRIGRNKARGNGGRDKRARKEEPDMSSERNKPKIYSMDRGELAIEIVVPTRFDGITKSIIDKIRSGLALTINLEQVSRQDFTRFLDFLAGAVYIMDSNMQYVNGRVLIVSPKNVKIIGGEFKEVYEVDPMTSVY